MFIVLKIAGSLTNRPERVRTVGFCTCGGGVSSVGTGALLTLELWVVRDGLVW